MTTVEILGRCKQGGHWRTPGNAYPDGTCKTCTYITHREREREREGRRQGAPNRAIPTYKGLTPEPWVDEARCGPKFLGVGVKFSRMTVNEKLETCQGCPVKAECADLGKSGTDSDEVYGGRLLRPHQPPGPAKDGKPLTSQAKRGQAIRSEARKHAALARELRATGASWGYIRYTVKPGQSLEAFYQMLLKYARDAVDDVLRAMVREDRKQRRAEAEVAA